MFRGYFDKIDYTLCPEVITDTYECFDDSGEINIETHEDVALNFRLLINGVWYVEYASAHDLILDSMIKDYGNYHECFKTSWQRDGAPSEWEYNLTNFYPFSCSCGEPGCNGIWRGINTKHRKHTVEWRIKNKDRNGYKFLDKSFYEFSGWKYNRMVQRLWEDLCDVADKCPDSDIVRFVNHVKSHENYSRWYGK